MSRIKRMQLILFFGIAEIVAVWRYVGRLAEHSVTTHGTLLFV